ncbi:MAG TPA: mechanosensitive ion channel domain-containing protein [Stellaceae bacterium]|nr:mechanosensitive ion channel domain-containing protein [Stellaceae bacterium]
MNFDLSPESVNRAVDVAWTWTAAFLPRFVAAVLILLVGSLIARWLSRAIFNATGRTAHIDATVRPILAAIVRYSILILVFIAALSQIGVQTASLFAVLGAAGIAIGLALQGTLSNIAAGLMLLWLRPFHVGDFIEVNGMAGTVREIGLFVCHLETFDGIFLFAPNSTIWNQALRNHTRNTGRLVSIDITVPAKADIDHAREILLAMARRDRRVLKRPQPRVFVESLTGAGLLLNLRVWATHENVGEVQRVIVEEAKAELDSAGIDTLHPQQVVRVIPPDSDPSRLLSTTQPYID